MKYCKVCRRKPRLKRRVNCEGVVFCSDDCYEGYEGSFNDDNHPYIDDYDAIRFEYMQWMKEYKDDLYKGWHCGSPKKEELMEDIDSFTDQFDEYYRLEGMDGVFSAEIYDYLLAFEELKEVIRSWQCDEKGYKKWCKAREKKQRG